MKLSKITILAISVFTSAFALNGYAADDGGLPKPQAETGPQKTRAEVKAERSKAAKSGELNRSADADPIPVKSTAATKSRAEVKTATADAKKANGGSLQTPKN